MKLQAKSQHEHIFNLQVQGDKYARLIVNQKQKLEEIEGAIKKTQSDIESLRALRKEADERGGGINAVKSRKANEQREIIRLENRLASVKSRESKLLSSNMELKRKVDRLRENRVLYNKIFDKYQRKLREIQTAMQETLDLSNELMADRDSLIMQANNENSTLEIEQNEFDDIYEKLTGIIRLERENAAEFRKISLSFDPSQIEMDYQRGDMGIDDEKALLGNLTVVTEVMKEEQMIALSVEEKLESYQTAFKKLEELTGVKDHNALTEAFTRLEEENFATYKYIQNINNESEQIEDQCQKILLEKQFYEDDLKEGTEHLRKRMMEDLEKTKERIIQEIDQLAIKKQESLNIFQTIANGVDKLFMAIGGGEMQQLPVLGSPSKVGRSLDGNTLTGFKLIPLNEMLLTHGITEGNIMQYLGLVEKRTDAILQECARKHQCKGGMVFPLNSIEPKAAPVAASTTGVPGATSPLAIHPILPNGLGELEDDLYGASDDEDERPLNKGELLTRAMKNAETMDRKIHKRALGIKKAVVKMN